jgi:ubiquinone/menaquinone biosynthesis C-methylase UbiE
MGSDTVFAGAVPQLYDRHLGPLLFQPFAVALAERLAGSGPDILETACGTGVVTRAILAARPDAVLTATDLNQAMLDVAAEQSQGRVTFRQADARALPFDDASFDAVACGFGMMFMPDKVAAYRELRRVLRPGGRLVASIWGRIEANPLMHVVEEAVAGMFPQDPPRFLSRTPCGYADAARIGRELREAGFDAVTVETVSAEARAETALGPAMGLCQGTPLRGEIEARDPEALPRATESAAKAVSERFGAGPVVAPQQSLILTAFRR